MAVCQEYIVAVLEGVDDGCIVSSWIMAVVSGVPHGCVGRNLW